MKWRKISGDNQPKKYPVCGKYINPIGEPYFENIDTPGELCEFDFWLDESPAPTHPEEPEATIQAIRKKTEEILAGGKETCSEYLKELGIGEEPEGASVIKRITPEDKERMKEQSYELQDDWRENVWWKQSERYPPVYPVPVEGQEEKRYSEAELKTELWKCYCDTKCGPDIDFETWYANTYLK